MIKESLGTKFIKQYPEEFSTRLKVQKASYLLTHGKSSPKVNLPYAWTFYLRGPYSSEMAHMLYHVNDCWSDCIREQVRLTEEELRAISHFKEFQGKLRILGDQSSEFTQDELLELVTTIIYIAEQVGNEKRRIMSRLKRLKPKLTQKGSSGLYERVHALLVQHQYI